METSTVLLTVIFCILSVLLTIPYGSRHLENAASTVGPDGLDCVGDYAYERKSGRNANGAERYNSGNTLAKCKTRCSALSACRSFDWNFVNNECWIHRTNVENSLSSVSGVDHYLRIDCPESTTFKTSGTTGLPPTVPDCIKNYRFEEFEDKYVLGGTKHTASNTLLKCLTYCANRPTTGSTACTAVDFNDANECWVHKTDPDNLARQTGDEGTVSHYVRKPCVEPTEGALPNCIDDYQYEVYPDKYSLGATLHSASNTLLKCLEHCSGKPTSGSSACTAVDFNDENKCWVHNTDADDLSRRDGDEGTVTQYVREPCDASSTGPPPECVDDYSYEEYPNKYSLGATIHSASNTLIKCLRHCSSKPTSGSNACTAVDFNEDHECWVHNTDSDDLDRKTGDAGTVTQYVREGLCDGSSTTPHTPKTTVPQPNLPVTFRLLFTNDYEATVEDVDAFLDTIRDDLCDEFGIRCSRLLRPRTASDVYKVITKKNPGPEIGSIVVEGELAEGLDGETTTQKIMEDFEDDWDSFKPRLTADNNGIRLTPDVDEDYDGFSWERIYPDDPDEKPEEDELLATEYWVLIGLGALAIVITIIAVVVICCLRRNSESSDKDLKEKEKEKKRAEQERKRREKEEKKRAEEERKAREKEEKMREKMDRDVEKAEENEYTDPDVVPSQAEDYSPSGLSDDDKAY